MTWRVLVGQSARVTVWPNGQITWNDAAQQALKCPKFVEIFYDSDGNRLGFRKFTQDSSDCLGVLFNEDMDYSIDAVIQLEDADLAFAEPYTADLQPPIPPTPPADLGDAGIWWIAVPE